jgi:predicted ATPase
LVLEDLHWVDPSTVELLELILYQGSTAPLCTVCTYRPEFDVPWPGRSHTTQISLQRLSRREVERMIYHLTGGKALPDEVLQQLMTRGDGIPLFVEELTKAVLASALLQEQDDAYTCSPSQSTQSIPTTLHAAFLARLDRLGAAKGVAQIGAVLGRQFPYEMLHRCSRH